MRNLMPARVEPGASDNESYPEIFIRVQPNGQAHQPHQQPLAPQQQPEQHVQMPQQLPPSEIDSKVILMGHEMVKLL